MNIMYRDGKRIPLPDVYRGVLIILVVIRHLLQYTVADEGGILTNFIWAVQMPGFMLVAGYFSAKRMGGMQDLKIRIVRSARHYLVPFFSWFLLIDTLICGRFQRNIIEGLRSVVWQVDTALWFLWVIFFLSVATALANYSLSRNSFRYLGTVLVFLFCAGTLALLLYLYGPDFMGAKFLLYYSVFYGFGWLLKWTEDYWKKVDHRIGQIFFFICLMFFVAIVLNYDLYHSNDGVISLLMRIIAGFTGNAVLFAACRKFTDMLLKMHLDFIGQITLEIYVTHMHIIPLFKKADSFYSVDGFMNFTLSLVILSLLTTIIIGVFKAIPLADCIFFGRITAGKKTEKMVA